MCTPQTGCTGPSDRLDDGGCNRCYYVLRNESLDQVRCLPDDGCIDRTFLNLPFDPVAPFPFPTRFCDPCHEHCQSCSGPEAYQCSQCVFASREDPENRPQCVGSCEDGEYVSCKRCLLCHEECDGCLGGSQHECIDCKNVKNFLGDDSRFECVPLGRCPSTNMRIWLIQHVINVILIVQNVLVQSPPIVHHVMILQDIPSFHQGVIILECMGAAIETLWQWRTVKHVC